jgi:hypothetical protein
MRRFAILLPVLLAFQVGVSPALAWTWPVDGPVLRPFDFEGSPYAAGHHRGIDIGAPAGAPVVAPAAGTISFAGTVPSGGRTVTIRTADGHSVTLVHLGSISVQRTAAVAEGAPVGTIGPSGEPELAEPYVHLGIRLTAEPNGYLDPLAFLPPRPVPPPAPAQEEPVEEPSAPPVDDPADEAPAELVPPASAPTPAPAPVLSGTHDPAAAPALASRARESFEASHVPARPELDSAGTDRGSLDERRPDISPKTVDRVFLGPSAVIPAFALAGPGQAGPDGRTRAFPWLWVLVAVGGAGLAAAGGLALSRQLRDAVAADGAPSMLPEGGVATAEDADRVRLGKENRVLLDRDLERILLAQAETFPDLDRDDDSPELVDAADDSGRPRHLGPHRSPRCLGSHNRRLRPAHIAL